MIYSFILTSGKPNGGIFEFYLTSGTGAWTSLTISSFILISGKPKGGSLISGSLACCFSESLL